MYARMKSLPSWTVSEGRRWGYTISTRQPMLVIKLGKWYISFDVCGTRHDCSIRKTDLPTQKPSWRCFYVNLGSNLWTNKE